MTAAVVAGAALQASAALAAGAGGDSSAVTPGAPASPPPAAAAQEALAASEDLAILKALAPLQLTRTQLSDLLPALQGAQAKLAELDAKEAAKLAAWRSSLEQARKDLLTGKSSGARASDQFALAQWGSAQKRAGLRGDLVSSVRAALDKILTPAQVAQMAASGQAVVLSQRMASWRGGLGGWGQGVPGAGGPGGGGPGGPGGRGTPADRLDRIRQMSPAEFDQFAARGANRFGGQSSPQFQQFTSFMNQVRNMPQSQYVLQRDQLAAQSFGQGRGGFGAALADNSADAARAFVDRYLLSPRAPIVVQDRLRSANGAAE
jgi:hypothetical protein